MVNRKTLIMTQGGFSGLSKFGSSFQTSSELTAAEMANSVIKTMQSNSISLPFSGSDVCGTFGTDIDLDLCVRWYFVSAFQPFSWIHSE